MIEGAEQTPSLCDLASHFAIEHERSFTRPLSLGLFGSGSDEYVYRRPPA